MSFPLIAGPCTLEDMGLNMEVATELARLEALYPVTVAFKGSFDKANRSRVDSPRGPGMREGLAMLARVREVTGLAVTTDVHEPGQAAVAAEFVDMLQVPALLCRQTDLLIACGESGRAVNVKKGQWMSPEEAEGIAGKLRHAGCEDFRITERGTAFGYAGLVVDMRSFTRTHAAAGCPVYFDATHSAGHPLLAPALACAAVAAGADGLFIETHPDPASAPCDGPYMLPLAELDGVLARVSAHVLARESVYA